MAQLGVERADGDPAWCVVHTNFGGADELEPASRARLLMSPACLEVLRKALHKASVDRVAFPLDRDDDETDRLIGHLLHFGFLL